MCYTMAIGKDITEIKVKLGKIEQKLEDMKCTIKHCPEPEKHVVIDKFMAKANVYIMIAAVVIGAVVAELIRFRFIG